MGMTPEQIAEIQELGKQMIKEMGLTQVERKVLPGGAPAGPPEGDGKLKSFGELPLGELLCAISRSHKGESDARLKALSEGSDSGGGFTVPEETAAPIIKRALERSIVEPLATVVPMRSDTYNYTIEDDLAHTASLHGGIIAYWTEEAGSKTVSQPKFRRVKLIAKKLTGFTYASDELLEDSAVDLGAYLTECFGGSIGWYKDYAFLRGSGVGQPLGIFGSGCLIQPTRAVANAISVLDIANLMARLLPASLYAPSTVFIASQSILPQIINLGSTYVTWINSSMNGAAQRIPTTLFGMPLYFTEKVPALGTTGDIGLYDLSYYLIGNRKGLKVDQSTEYRFATDETTWRFVTRVDGQPLMAAAFTPKNGSTLSPFVQLSSATA